MDGVRFDDLARAVGRPSARRTALLAAAPMVWALLRAGDVAARCGRVLDRCDRSGDCCDGARCRRRRCRCRAGLTKCADGRCHDLASDPRHCGACDSPCDPTQQCLVLDCVPCPGDVPACNHACCEAGVACLPRSDDGEPTCCPADRVFVECQPEWETTEADGRPVCDVPTGTEPPRTCCTRADLCGSRCCLGKLRCGEACEVVSPAWLRSRSGN
jgi:hypothetical protein